MILVTGGAGFIGSNFILDWLAAGSEPVINLDRLTYAGNLENLASVAADPRYRFERLDICERDAVLEFVVEMDGITVNGVDMIHWNDEGRITDFKVMIRPLKGMNVVREKMAAMLGVAPSA